MILSSYKKYTTRVVLFVLLLSLVGIAWYGIVPIKQAIYEKMRGIQEFYARRENREKQVARLPELKAQYDTVLQNEKLLDILISEDKVVDFVKMLEGLASGTHIEISITARDNGKITEAKKVPIKPDQSNNGNSDGGSTAKQKAVTILDDIPFDRYLYLNVKVRGQYEDIVVFLHKMETLPVGLDVVKVDMKKGTTESPAGIALGTGINPFAPGGNAPAGSVELPAVKKDIFEAVFDVLVYVRK